MIKNLRPSLRALLIHLASCLLVLVYRFTLADQTNPPSLFALTLAQGILATVLGILVELRAWWIPINLAFFPLLALALSQTINPLWYFLIFVLILLLNWNAFGEQVPLYLSGRKTIAALTQQLNDHEKFVFADFGCGIASVLVKVAKAHPQAEFIGYETAPLSFLVAKLRSIGISNLTIKRTSFWSTEWNQYDVIYCFLSPAPMPEIAKMTGNKMKLGAKLISNTFALPGHTPITTINVGDMRQTQLFVYQF